MYMYLSFSRIESVPLECLGYTVPPMGNVTLKKPGKGFVYKYVYIRYIKSSPSNKGLSPQACIIFPIAFS